MAKNLSTFAIARLLQVDPGSVANWIDRGLLRAHRTPGGHRRVMPDDLVVFMRGHNMPVPPELSAGIVKILIAAQSSDTTNSIASAIQTQHPEYEVTQANHSFGAGAIAATIQPNVLILDLTMPGIGDGDVCQIVKSHQSTQHAKILAIAPESDESALQNTPEAQARALRTPVDMDLLLRELDALVA